MPRGTDWTKYATQVAELRMDASIFFPHLDNSRAGLRRARVGLAQNKISKEIRIQVRAVGLGVQVRRFTGNRRILDEPLVQAQPAVKAHVEALDRCSERGCPFPPGVSGLCRQHEFWFNYGTSPIGSSLGDKSLEGS